MTVINAKRTKLVVLHIRNDKILSLLNILSRSCCIINNNILDLYYKIIIYYCAFLIPHFKFLFIVINNYKQIVSLLFLGSAYLNF